MLRIPNTAAALTTLAVIDLVSVGGVIALHASLGDTVPVAVHVAETLVVGALGVSCAYIIWKFLGRPDPVAAPMDEAAFARLREETAENLRVLQSDISGLGTAILKRLPVKNESTGEDDKLDSVAASLNDLAISLIEARESLGGISGELAEAKSVIFEMQAQLDQQADALRAFEQKTHAERTPPQIHAEYHATPPEFDAGIGAAPGSLGKALAYGAAGSAVARLIGGAARPDAATVSTLEAPIAIAPLASADIDGVYDEGEGSPPPGVLDPESMEPEWEAPGEDYHELRDPLSESFARTVAPEAVGVIDGAEEPLMRFDDSIHIDLDTIDNELLPLEDEHIVRRKPRPPSKNETAIIAHVMIGIGNKPYLRGIGGDLSPLKGVPMEYVEVGRWQWISPTVGEPATVSLWKNDEDPADGDLIEVPAGTTVEIRPQFGV